ncbi:LuxR C-terminal-related transcriptional regulator [Brucepastera parasyntrophica]|uniref:helix-turn-helix transcriptional regulator n=1 Tax=Brucepastera parasyntrophica TaxID=2880008 RepID=UPI00210E7B3A|nr:LuxR C-terminal-related transcriptional regulator [Brucepastera parasyntrophica]ULQ60335.1 LuxR C-terminal-related transcriptional regulator [Brucepastera parasyntrophica]
MEHVMNGAGRGQDYLYSAGASYMVFDLNAAKQKAYQAIYRAQENDQHDIICLARSLLAQTAFMRGDFKEATEHITFICDYITEKNLTPLFDMRESSRNWIYVKMRDLSKVSSWIFTEYNNPRQPPLTSGASSIMHAQYLLAAEKFNELIAFLDPLENMCRKKGIWNGILTAHIMRAVAYSKLDKNDLSMDSFRKAYDISHQNGIIAPFIESGGYMRSLVEIARKDERHSFDADWLDLIYRKAFSFSRLYQTMVKTYKHENKTHNNSQNISLSKRESQVLQELANGLTQDQIASFYGISSGTVKTHVKSIYNKMGAINRADAIRIAAEFGLIG